MANPKYRYPGRIFVTYGTTIGASYNSNPANQTGYDAVPTYVEAAEKISAELLETVKSNGLLGVKAAREISSRHFECP